MRPARALEFRRREDGRVEVLRPKFGRGRLGRFVAARVRKPHVSVHLDARGSFVWDQCDGERTVEEIAEALEQRDGPTDDLRRRLVRFLVGLARQGMVDWR